MEAAPSGCASHASVRVPFANPAAETSMSIGPSTTSTPYLVPSKAGISFTSLLTTGDTAGLKPDGVTPWKMVGIPDGLGLFDNGNGTVTLLMNQELGNTSGV